MIVSMFPEPRERARAIGVFSFVGAAGASIGLIVGGVLTQAVNWHWIFFVNVPVGLVALLLAGRVIAPTGCAADRDAGLRRGADVAGALLVTAALMLGVYAIVTAADHGWTAPAQPRLRRRRDRPVRRLPGPEATAARPLLPLRLLGTRLTGGANLVQALLIAGMMGFQFMFALYLQRALGYRPAQVGAAFLPIAMGIGALSLGLSPRLNSAVRAASRTAGRPRL